MENNGFVYSLMSGSRKSSIFCEARITIQLVNGSDRVTNAEELVTHIRQNIEKHGVLESAVRIKQTLHAEAQEGIISNVGVPIEILTFRTDAHRMQTEAYLLQSLFGIDVLSLGIKGFELFFADLIEVFHNWEIRRFLLAVVSRVCNAESGVKLHQKYLDGVKLLIREILVGVSLSTFLSSSSALDIFARSSAVNCASIFCESPAVSTLIPPEKNETIAMTGINIARRMQRITVSAFFKAFLFVSIATAIFFSAAPIVALIIIPPNRKTPTDSASRLVLHFIMYSVIYFAFKFIKNQIIKLDYKANRYSGDNTSFSHSLEFP